MDVVQYLISLRIDVNAQNDNGDTALHLATNKNHIDVVQVLLQVGANRNIQNKAGKTAPDLARTAEMKKALPDFDPNEAANMVVMASDDDDDDDDW